MLFTDYPFPVATQPQAVALGFFDGVHLGHQELLRELSRMAEERGLNPAVFTFADHPKRNVRTDFPGLIMTQEERIHHLEQSGVRTVYMAPADSRVLDLTPEAFIDEILKDRLKARLIICGEDFRFGNKASGDIATLREHAGEAYELCVIPDLYAGGDIISSTRIREALIQGDMAAAAEMLGHPFYYKSRVVQGKKLGRRLGFPTINMPIEEGLVIARTGVYASRVWIGDKGYCGLSNLGYKPTVGVFEKPSLETYLYDYDGDLYGTTLRVELLRHFRDEEKFNTVEEMRDVVLKDKENVAEWFAAQGEPCSGHGVSC